MPKDSPWIKDRKSRRILTFSIFLVSVMCAGPARVSAHRVVLFAYVEGDTVFTESHFSNGRKCQNSRIEVVDGSGNKLLEGKTDENGEFSFKAPKTTDLKIVLTASMGHQDEYVITAGELAEGVERKAQTLEPHGTGTEPLHMEGGEKDGATVGQLTRLELEQIRTVVEQALDEKMKPIMKLLVKRRSEKVSFVQVMGGIGFIFGIMGIIMYVRSRRGR